VPPLFTLESRDAMPLSCALRIRVYHGFGDDRIQVRAGIPRVARKSVLDLVDYVEWTSSSDNDADPNGTKVTMSVRISNGMSIPGLDISISVESGIREFRFTARPIPGDEPLALFGRVSEALHETEAQVVKYDVYGALEARNTALHLITGQLGAPDWPINWVEGMRGAHRPVSGVQVVAISGTSVETLRLGRRTIGRIYTVGPFRHCVLGEIAPENIAVSRSIQAEEIYETLEAALASGGMKIGDLVRTWLFIDDIVTWYPSFNLVRTGFFRRKGLLDGRVPASTGIGGKTYGRPALSAAAWAAVSASGSGSIVEVPSPLQCPATEYGSSFSRAIELSSETGRTLLVSGSASIDPDGRSVFPGDGNAQIGHAMKVVREMLASRGMDLLDITRAVVYFKDIQDAPLFARWCLDNEVANLPSVALQTDVCREELLFEIEVDASREHFVSPPDVMRASVARPQS
jgi:enamine deaminase RidA (YjgF/YER057c/UK114 family)